MIPAILPPSLPSHLEWDSNRYQHPLGACLGCRVETSRTCPQGARGRVCVCVVCLTLGDGLLASEILARRRQLPCHLPTPPTWILQQSVSLDFTNSDRGGSLDLYLASNQMDPGPAWNSMSSTSPPDVLRTSLNDPPAPSIGVLGSPTVK